MKRTLILIAVTLFFMFTVSNVLGEELTPAQKEVWKVVEAAWASFQRGEIDATNVTEDNLEWWAKRAKPRGGEILKANYEGWLNYDKPVTYELKPINIQISGDVAIAYYKFHWKGKILEELGRQVSTFIKEDNQWKHFGGMGCSCKEASRCP
jgi:ketosteroid isomerase-like protein